MAVEEAVAAAEKAFGKVGKADAEVRKHAEAALSGAAASEEAVAEREAAAAAWTACEKERVAAIAEEARVYTLIEAAEAAVQMEIDARWRGKQAQTGGHLGKGGRRCGRCFTDGDSEEE